jgi:hypothetical protein
VPVEADEPRPEELVEDDPDDRPDVDDVERLPLSLVLGP